MKKFFTIAAGLLLATMGTTMYASVTPTSTTGPNASGVITSTFASKWDTTTDGSYPQVESDQLQAYVTDSNGLNLYIPFKNVGWTSEKKSPTVTFNLSDIITYNGHYTLTVPEGYIMVMETMDYENDENAEYTYEFDWTIGEENTGTNYSPVYNVNDNVVNVNWTNVTSLQAGNTKGATVKNNATQVVTNLGYEDYANPHIRIAEGNTLRVNMGSGSTLLPAGSYTLSVPAGFVKFNGGSDTNEALEYTFNLVVFEQGTVNFYGPTDISGNPSNSYSSVKGTITLEFANITDIKAESMLSGITVNGVEVDASNITVPGLPANIININVTGNSGLVNGQNTLKVGASNFTLTDKNGKQGPNSDLEYTFQYSGVGQKDPTVQINFNLSVATDYVDAMEESELPNAVTISYTALKDGTYQSIEVPVESSLVTYEFPYGVNVDIAPVGKYMVTNVANISGDLVIESTSDESGSTSSGVADYDAVWSFSIPANPTFDSAFVSVEVGVTPANVFFNFECKDTDVTTSAQDLVTIDYGTSVNHVSTDNGYRIYLAPTGSTLKVTPVTDYAIKDVVITNTNGQNVTLANLSNYGSSYTESNGVYTFTLGNAASGLTFLFDVEPTSKAGTDITINYTGEDLMAFAWTYVTTRTMTSTIDVDSDEFVYTYTTPDSALDLYFIPDDSDFKVEVTCVKSSNNAAYGEVSEAPNMGTNAIQLSIPVDETTGKIPSDLVVTVTVKPSNSFVTANFSISGEGIANPGSYVTVSYSDGTIDVTSGFGGETVAAGTVFTVAPVDGYMISEISTFAEGVATISKPVNEEDAWTVSILNEPADTFATFSVTVQKYSAINSINKIEDDAEIYNLQGVKVSKNNVSNGLYIINGKKVMVK